MASDDDRKQKTFYPEVDTAEWIEETAKKSERSESYVTSRIIEEIADSINFESVDIHNCTFKAEDDN